jgi:hypothetical protein
MAKLCHDRAAGGLYMMLYPMLWRSRDCNRLKY